MFKERNKDANIETVLLNPLVKEAESHKETEDSFCNFAWYLLQKYNLVNAELEVPWNFPLPLADFLREKGVKLTAQTSLCPERAQKTGSEISAIRESVQKTEKAFSLIHEILQNSTIEKDNVMHEGKILTSEFLKKEAEKLLLEEDMINEEGIIISTALQTAIPHHPGEGPIKAREPIVCDIFPRNRKTGYFADITRTFIKGEPSAQLQKMYEAVFLAQEAGIRAVKPGVKAREVHKVCVELLLNAGYDVGDKGFVHNTGHGVGLEVHEDPRLGEKFETELAAGNVITVEPGLYYSEIGGIRIEDDVLVTEHGAENLTSFPKDWIIS